MCAHIFFTLYRVSVWEKNKEYFRIGYYVISWGLPWIPTIIVLAKKKIVGGGFFCTIDGSASDGW